ncbi:sensor histidine kinase [Flavobacterium sp. PLA-1-15]|uniref:sensor histidine kinase n=1 Tax=Flavobacterium sp. PLA-1-15 TaxID=3380533 RepID=UPI003B822B2D
MREIVKINLDNEMDLILAHKRSMKIAEMCGLPSSAQTRFSTAVSEIARCCIANGKDSVLVLGITTIRPTHKEITAVLTDAIDLKQCSPEAYRYASKISGTISYDYSNNQSTTQLTQSILQPGLLSEQKMKGLVDYFKFEPPLSPYDEIRKKNIELIALSEKLGESENRYRQLSNTLPVLICVVDDRNKVLLTNDWLKNYVGLPLLAFDRSVLSGFIAPEDLDRLLTGWDMAKKSASSYHGELRIKHKADYVWHIVSIVPNKLEDGSFSNWLVSFFDINAQKIVEATLKDNSELKRIQRELEGSNAKLSFKNKELEQFAYVASHDLQEPLRKIMIMLSRAGEHLSEEERERYYFGRISASAQRLSALIADLLNYSRADYNALLRKEIDLNDVLMQAQSDLSFIIEEKGAVVLSDELPKLNGLETQLQQLFYNLISNALKFNANTPVITITAKTVSDRQSPAMVNRAGDFHLIEVTDNGIGMDADYSGRIFEMFQRLHAREHFEGNGIGLALCKRIIENHNGFIDFTSVPGEGTTFKIYLPVS